MHARCLAATALEACLCHGLRAEQPGVARVTLLTVLGECGAAQHDAQLHACFDLALRTKFVHVRERGGASLPVH